MRKCGLYRECNELTRKAFTLIELLVVISIISLLLSVILPALKRAREQGKLTLCMNNTRQLNMGLSLYAEDNAGMLPHYADFLADGVTEDVTKRWMFLAAKYVSQDILWTASGNSGTGRGRGVIYCSSGYYHEKNDARFGNYGANIEFINTPVDNRRRPNPNFKIIQIPTPGQRILMMDSGGYISGAYYITSCHGGYWYVPGTRPDLDPASLGIVPELHNDFLKGRHGTQVVLGWADWHISAIKGNVLGDEVMRNNSRWFSAARQ